MGGGARAGAEPWSGRRRRAAPTGGRSVGPARPVSWRGCARRSGSAERSHLVDEYRPGRFEGQRKSCGWPLVLAAMCQVRGRVQSSLNCCAWRRPARAVGPRTSAARRSPSVQASCSRSRRFFSRRRRISALTASSRCPSEHPNAQAIWPPGPAWSRGQRVGRQTQSRHQRPRQPLSGPGPGRGRSAAPSW